MFWDSALALKKELVQLADRHRPVRSKEPEGDVFRAGQSAQTLIALGVAPDPTIKGEYRVAVRTFDRRASTLQLLDRIIQAAGEPQIEHAEIGRVSALRPVGDTPVIYRRLQRPLSPGYSLGHFKGGVGSIGGFVTREQGSVYLLACGGALRHGEGGRRGDPVLQPALQDGGVVSGSTVAVLESSSRLQLRGNQHDVAIARVHKHLDVHLSYGGVRLAGTRGEPRGGERVFKLGRTTGRSNGIVTATQLDGITVDYSGHPARLKDRLFDGLIEIRTAAGRFSMGGDGGAMIVDQEGMALGILLAGSVRRDMTYASPIEPVLASFEVSLLR